MWSAPGPLQDACTLGRDGPCADAGSCPPKQGERHHKGRRTHGPGPAGAEPHGRLRLCFRTRGFLCGSPGKESAHKAGDLGWIPGLGRSPGEGKSYPLLHSGLENSMHRGGWWATVHGVIKSRTRLSDFHSLAQDPEPVGRQLAPSWTGHGAGGRGVSALRLGAPVGRWGGGRGGPPGELEGKRGPSAGCGSAGERGTRHSSPGANMWGVLDRRACRAASLVSTHSSREPPHPSEKSPQTLPVLPPCRPIR